MSADRLTTAQAATRLNCHPQTLRNWMREGLVKAVCFRGKTPKGDRYKFDVAELEAFERLRWENVEPANK